MGDESWDWKAGEEVVMLGWQNGSGDHPELRLCPGWVCGFPAVKLQNNNVGASEPSHLCSQTTLCQSFFPCSSPEMPPSSERPLEGDGSANTEHVFSHLLAAHSVPSMMLNVHAASQLWQTPSMAITLLHTWRNCGMEIQELVHTVPLDWPEAQPWTQGSLSRAFSDPEP